jgi:hypothetical protein
MFGRRRVVWALFVVGFCGGHFRGMAVGQEGKQPCRAENMLLRAILLHGEGTLIEGGLALKPR